MLAGRRIGLLTAAASRQGGGVFEAVVAQAEVIRSLGGEAQIFALDDSDAALDRERFGTARVTLAGVAGPRLIGFAPSLIGDLLAADLDCLHLHGIWMYPSHAGAVWARRTRRPYFISPHGMLDPWITARGRWKKALARRGYERTGWRAATALHALTRREADDIARETARTDSIVIPNAGPAVDQATTGGRPPTVLYLGRIHPKKNLIALTHAWQAVARPDGARLVIAGWGADSDIAELKAALAAGDASASFIGPVYGAEKHRLLREARYMVLPSHSEGLPMAVLEAWAAGTPTIMTSECNLPEGFAARAARECGYDVAAIAAALGDALALDEAGWTGMAQAAQELAAKSFSAEVIAHKWGDVYASAMSQSSRQ